MLMRHPHPVFQFTHMLPYGAVLHDGGVQFVVFSRSATAMRLLLYDHVDDREPADVVPFDRDADRLGDIWSLFVPGLGPGQLYHFQADGPRDPERGLWFDGRARLIDPYAKALAGSFQKSDDGIIRPPKCVVIDDYFDWEGDRHLRRDLSETIIYEMHVRGFTQSNTSRVRYPGTYLGVIEKIPYLKSLGVTAVELMPVHEFPILDIWGNPPQPKNYWGYDPLAFFAPHRGYAVGTEPGCQVIEFKQMVQALHQAGIEVILDVVFNHTCEGNELGPVLSFKGLENHVYYHIANGGSRYSNYSGCGNTINGNHPIVREMIFNCLRHWVHNYHVDGFRFDLASILSRNRHGHLVPNPPLVETIADDPLLADTKIIAEAWDAAGAYQVGSFSDHLRWAEWNGRYRDDVRRFWRGDAGMLGALATRLCGSSDLYKRTGRPPSCSINFITSHDGFTLNDLVTYKDKHNEANGEGNRDGDNNNLSDNYGVEGPTRRRPVRELRHAADQEHVRDAAAEPGRADDRGRRRMLPHATWQQQRLLPGQRHLLVRLATGPPELRHRAVRPDADPLPTRPVERPAQTVPDRQTARQRRPARRELVQSAGRPRRLGQCRPGDDLRADGARPVGRPLRHVTAPSADVQFDAGPARVHDSCTGGQSTVAIVHRHRQPVPRGHLSRSGWACAAGQSPRHAHLSLAAVLRGAVRRTVHEETDHGRAAVSCSTVACSSC